MGAPLPERQLQIAPATIQKDKNLQNQSQIDFRYIKLSKKAMQRR